MTFLDLVSKRQKAGYLPQEPDMFILSSYLFRRGSFFLTHLVIHYIFYSIGVHAQSLSHVHSLQYERNMLCERDMDHSPPGSPVHGIFQPTGVGCHFLLQGIFSTQGLNPGLLYFLHWQASSLPLSHWGIPMLLSI